MCDNQSGKEKNRKTERKKLQEKKRKENYNRSSRVFSHYRKKTEFFKQTSPTKTIPKMSRAVVTPA